MLGDLNAVQGLKGKDLEILPGSTKKIAVIVHKGQKAAYAGAEWLNGLSATLTSQASHMRK